MNKKNIIISAIFIALAGYVPTAQAMLSKEISPEKQEQIRVQNALFQACIIGNYKIVAQSIIYGANINEITTHDFSPLHLACQSSSFEIVNFLLEKGAKIEALTSHLDTPLHIACQNGQTKSVKVLLDNGALLEARDSEQCTPLHSACFGKHLDVVKLVVMFYKAQINAQAFRQFTPLHIACQNSDEKMVVFLIANEANKEALNDEGLTPLHLACQNGYTKIVEFLIQSGANSEALTKTKLSPLHLACFDGHLDVVQLLIKLKPALVHALQIDGATALHIAVAGGNVPVVEKLLESDIDICVIDLFGLTALDHAYDQKNNAIIELFAKHGAKLITEEEAQENQQAFFGELNQEEQQKEFETQISDLELDLSQVKGEGVISTSTPFTISSRPPLLTATAPKQKCIKSINTRAKSETQATKLKSSSANLSNEYLVLVHENFKWPKSLNKKQQGAVRDHLRQLKRWPITFGLDVKELKLKGQINVFRLRVGGHRIIFSVDEKNNTIKIHEIGLRKNIYKNIKFNLNQ